MQATLQILNGPEAGRRILIKSGQVLRFGRSEWSDIAFPYDPALADVHFAVETGDDAVTVTDLSGRGAMQVDGAEVVSGPVHSGQRISAGSLAFEVAIEVLFARSESGTGPVAVTLPEAPAAPRVKSACEVCETVDLSDAARELLDDSTGVLPFIELLTERELPVDALRVLATWLPKRKAVWWGAECVASACRTAPDSVLALLDTARRWVREPTEKNRRAAMSVAETANARTPSCWIVQGAAWSGGSLTPEGLPVVPPDERLTARALMGALLLAAVYSDPARRTENLRDFIEQGKQLAQVRLEWETEEDLIPIADHPAR